MLADEFAERIARALGSDAPQIYMNGFITQIGTGDIMVIAERNGAPSAVLNLSYTMAKTLALSLGSAIAQIEENAKREIMTASDVERVFEAPEKKT